MTQPRIFLVLLLSYLTNCLGQNSKTSVSIKSENQSLKQTSFVPSDSNQFYFPLKTFRDSSLLKVFPDSSFYISHDRSVNTRYSKNLFIMREPIVYMDKSQNEVFRFTWLRSFEEPIAIRIEKHDESYLIFWKSCSLNNDNNPAKLTVTKQKRIDKQTWDEFQSRISQIDFWYLKTNENVFDNDGSHWILEGKTPEKYHVVDRWSPKNESAFYQCCDFLIELTNLKIKNRDKY
jgi:hypothetical protein